MCFYSDDFYKSQKDGSLESAREIVPLVMELINPKSVIDVGCGVGTWLSVFRKLGVKDILGTDGYWVNNKMLLIPEEQFKAADLTNPLRLDKKFDLVISLEVAEHLPKDCAETFVESLVSLGQVVLFAAAIPEQGGAGHLNEQWPEYWADLFKKHGYIVIDCLRKAIWQNSYIDFWYAQNILLFCKKEYLENNIRLKEEYAKTNAAMLSLVHPQHYLIIKDLSNWSLKNILLRLPYVISKSLVNRVRRLLKQNI